MRQAEISSGRGVTIARRTVFDYISNIYIFPPEPYRVNKLSQEFAGCPYKRTPLLVFVKTRGFANKHNFGIGISFAGDSMSAGGMKVTTCTLGYFRIYTLE